MYPILFWGFCLWLAELLRLLVLQFLSNLENSWPFFTQILFCCSFHNQITQPLTVMQYDWEINFVVLIKIVKDLGVVCCHSISSNMNDVLSDLMVPVGWGTISLSPGRKNYHLFELDPNSRMVVTSSNLITRSKFFLDSLRIKCKW